MAEWIDYSKDSKGNYRLYKMMDMVEEEEKIKYLVDSINGGVTSTARKTQEMWFLTKKADIYIIYIRSKYNSYN